MSKKGERFEYWGEGDNWNFHYRAKNGEILGEPSYSSEKNVLKAIAAWRGCADALAVQIEPPEFEHEHEDRISDAETEEIFGKEV